jgi:hypothetical protein
MRRGAAQPRLYHPYWRTALAASDANHVTISWVCAILGEEDDGLRYQSQRHSTSPCPFSSAMNLQYAPATNTSPATMALLTAAYAAARADGVRMRWRKKSTPARP